MAMGQWSLLTALVLFVWGAKGASDVLFTCSFARDMCGMENQARGTWQREYLSVEGRRGPAMVVRGNDADNQMARLLTHQVASRGARAACLRFQYRIEGLTPASLSVIKQGLVTEYLFATARRTGTGWQRAHVDFQFLGDDAMFYFEADTRVQESGTSLVAFKDLIITKHSCQSRVAPNRRRPL